VWSARAPTTTREGARAPQIKALPKSGSASGGQGFPLIEGGNFLTKPFQALKLSQTIRQKLDAKA